MSQFLRGPLGYLPFFITGIDESQVFLAIVVKSKWAVINRIALHFYSAPSESPL
jgi:hypothetical protein